MPSEQENAGDHRELDQVVTVGRAADNKKYHAPNEDEEPLCGAKAKSREVDNRPDYNLKDPAVLPHHSLCKFCEDRLNGGNGSMGAPKGPNLASKLEGMDT